MPPLPAASWQPDPENPNQLRWWDGQNWSDATAPLPSSIAASDPAFGADASAETPPPRARRRGWRTALIIAGALIVGGVLARWSPVAVVLAVLAIVAAALVALIARPLPVVGLHSRRSGLAALGVAALVLTGGGVASGSTGSPEGPAASTTVQTSVQATSAPLSPEPKPTPTTFETETEELAIPFERTTVDDPQLDKGTTAITTNGVDGVKVITYRVTLVDGVEVAREAVSEEVQTAPVTEVTAVGSRVPAPQPKAPVQQSNAGCDPNYTGACVPVASDVDCEGGGGNGPAYVRGPVRIVGSDIYDLDRDGDGVACDK